MTSKSLGSRFNTMINHKQKLEYKSVQWHFGRNIKIPNSWEFVKLKTIIQKTQLGTDKVGVVDGKGFPLIKMGNLTFGGFDFTKLEYIEKSTLPDLENYLLENNDFLFNTRNSDILVGKCAVWKSEIPNAIFNNNIMRIWFSNKIYSSDFVSYFFNSELGRKSLRRLVDQTTNVAAIYYKNLSQLKICIPSIQEQKKITSILSNVDNAIQNSNQLIKQTQRLKKGIMQKLFTKGIGHTKFKKVKWYYKTKIEIPDKWNLVTINDLITKNIILEIQDGNHGELHPKSSDFVESGVPFVTADCIIDNKIDFTKTKFLPKKFLHILRIGFSKENDVILTHKGSLGFCCIVPKGIENLILSPQTTYYRLSSNLMPQFLFYVFQSFMFQFQLLRLGKQSTRDYVGILMQKKLLIPFIPISEQKQIVSVLSNIDSNFEKQKLNKSNLELLKKGLMQKLLTGTIRVKF